jgi:hypothetical protein
MYRFTLRLGGNERWLDRLGPLVRAHLEHHGKVELDAHHSQYGWWGRLTLASVDGAGLPKTYAVTFATRSHRLPGEGVLEEPLTDERIALAIGHAIGSVRSQYERYG